MQVFTSGQFGRKSGPDGVFPNFRSWGIPRLAPILQQVKYLLGRNRPRCYIRFVRHYRLIACLLCILGCSVIAAAQEKTYSADSLLATFQKGSPVSIKGNEIKFVGEIAEVKKSRVVFKSSGDDKIICELVSPIGSSKDVPVVGGSLTV